MGGNSRCCIVQSNPCGPWTQLRALQRAFLDASHFAATTVYSLFHALRASRSWSWNRASISVTVARLGVGHSIPGRGKSFSSSPKRPNRLKRPTQPPVKWETGALLPEIKRPGRETHVSPRTSAALQCAWGYLHASIRFHSVYRDIYLSLFLEVFTIRHTQIFRLLGYSVA